MRKCPVNESVHDHKRSLDPGQESSILAYINKRESLLSPWPRYVPMLFEA